MKREVPPFYDVVKLMRVGIEKAFDCNIDFYTEGLMIFTFNDHGDDYLSLRVKDGEFTVNTGPAITEKNLYSVAKAFRNAAKCMEALQVKPVQTMA